MSRIYNWNAPATLAYWPGQATQRAYPTLSDAIREAHVEAGRNPWIVTQDGEIIHSREIAAPRLKRRQSRRGWAHPTKRKAGP